MNPSDLIVFAIFIGVAVLVTHLKRRHTRSVRARAQRLLEIAEDDNARAVRTGVEVRRKSSDRTVRVHWASLDLSPPWDDLSCALSRLPPGDDAVILADPRETEPLAAEVGDPACREALKALSLQRALRAFLALPGDRTIRKGVVRAEVVDLPDDAWSLAGLKSEVGDVQGALTASPDSARG